MVDSRARACVGAFASGLGAAGAAGAAVIAAACWRRAHRGWVGSLGLDTVEVSQGLEIVVLATAGLVAAWLATLLLIGAVAALPGRATAPLRGLADRMAPRLAPRVAAALVTAVVTLTPLGAAHAATASVTGGHGPTPAASMTRTPEAARPLEAGEGTLPQWAGVWDVQPRGPEVATRAPEPGWRPTAPRPRPDPESISLVSRGAADQDVVVVRAGDTLWHIAARHLGEDADAAAIAEAWPRWYEANRALIGSDPDYLLPGTRLVPPAQTSSQEVAP